MKLDHEQYEILMTALQNYRGELYINSGDTTVLNKVNDLCQAIEDEKKSLDLDQKKIPVTEDMDKVEKPNPITMAEAVDISPDTDVGSETGIERDYAKQGKPGCGVCDD